MGERHQVPLPREGWLYLYIMVQGLRVARYATTAYKVAK